MPTSRRKAEIRSEAFWAAALRSERHRILSLLAALFIAVMVSLIREWAADVPGWFRQFLPVPEPDRLFGELNKLQALLEQYPSIDDEQKPLLLDALRKQGQRLRKLNAWRELNT